VRSLDPRGNLRGVLQQTATFILSELVKTYPSIAFHGKGQRLAVGTHEGAVVVYDLKTATRLYVLESHHKRASAVSYSPDGRRLVTVSLEESNVKSVRLYFMRCHY
jgi:WD40 repeat protein